MLQSYIDSIVALAIDGKINIRFNVFPPQSPYFLVPKVVYQLTKNANAKYRDGMFTKTETETLMRAIEEELYKDPVSCEHFRKLLSMLSAKEDNVTKGTLTLTWTITKGNWRGDSNGQDGGGHHKNGGLS